MIDKAVFNVLLVLAIVNLVSTTALWVAFLWRSLVKGE